MNARSGGAVREIVLLTATGFVVVLGAIFLPAAYFHYRIHESGKPFESRWNRKFSEARSSAASLIADELWKSEPPPIVETEALAGGEFDDRTNRFSDP